MSEIIDEISVKKIWQLNKNIKNLDSPLLKEFESLLNEDFKDRVTQGK